MFKERLKELRKQRKMTQEELGKKVGSNKSYIWELENKETIRPSAELVTALAKNLNTTVEYLMEGDSSNQDSVFFREYNELKPETKMQLKNIMKALKDS